MTTILAGIGIAFYQGADFAAICFAYFPIIMVCIVLFGAQVKRTAIGKYMVSKRLGGVVEEILSSIKLVVSFAQEEKEFAKFEKLADESRHTAHNAEIYLSSFIAMFRFFIFGFYVYSFWIASAYIKDRVNNPKTGNPYTLAELLSVLVSLITGMTMLFGLTPNIQAIIRAKVVGAGIFEVIDRVPAIKDNDVALKNFELKEFLLF